LFLILLPEFFLLLIFILLLQHPIQILLSLRDFNLEISLLETVSNHHFTLERFHIVVHAKDHCVGFSDNISGMTVLVRKLCMIYYSLSFLGK